MTESVAAVLTPPGVAAITVVRLAGPLNAAFAAAHLSRSPKPGRCVYCDLRDGDTVLDDVLAVDVGGGRLDLNLHGGAYVVQAVSELLQRFGYRQVDWTDAADSCVDAADRIERQVALDLPRAKSVETLRLLTIQPEAWRAMVAAGNRSAAAAAVADRALQRMLETPTVAIVGPANVGKSTLANALIGRPASITADLPGTTRDWVGEDANLDGLVVRLVDTPGERETDDPIEAAAQQAARPVVAGADLVIVAIDQSVPGDADARSLLSLHTTALIVRTKADRPSRSDLAADALAVSAFDGTGLAGLCRSIRERLGCFDTSTPSARCWTADQRTAVQAWLNGGPPLDAFIWPPGVYNPPRPRPTA